MIGIIYRILTRVSIQTDIILFMQFAFGPLSLSFCTDPIASAYAYVYISLIDALGTHRHSYIIRVIITCSTGPVKYECMPLLAAMIELCKAPFSIERTTSKLGVPTHQIISRSIRKSAVATFF